MPGMSAESPSPGWHRGATNALVKGGADSNFAKHILCAHALAVCLTQDFA